MTGQFSDLVPCNFQKPLSIKVCFVFIPISGPRFVVQIGEKTIDYNEEFRLFLTTRNPSPEIPPDAASVITEVNFTTTRAGLTGQVGFTLLGLWQ